MKAVVITADGLKIQDVPRPDPKPDEVLVRVRAAGLNRADLAMTSGLAYGACTAYLDTFRANDAQSNSARSLRENRY